MPGGRLQLVSRGNYNREYNRKVAGSKKKRNKKKVKNMTKSQLNKVIDQRAIDTQKTQVQYFMRLSDNMNPSGGLYNASVFMIEPTGMDSLLPNYGNLTDGARKIYVEYINAYIFFNENDTGVNDTKRNFIRHMLVYKDDETDASVSEVEGMFDSYAGNQTVVEESMNAVIPRSDAIWARQDSGWIPYSAERGTSVSTGVTITDVPNFVYPFRKYKKTLKIKKEYQVTGNGTLVDWHTPTIALLFTGLSTASPDCTCYFHLYYKVLA